MATDVRVDLQQAVLQTRVVVIFALAFLTLSGTALKAKSKKPPPSGPKIKFSQPHGFYERPFELSLSASSGKGQVRYTTNGSVPKSTSAHLYDAPLKISATTVLRTALFEGEAMVDSVETRTFIFPRDVLKQTGAGFPQTWGTNQGKPVPADYEMDPEIVNRSEYAGMLETALKSIPTLCVAMEPQDLFDPVHGIYVNARQSGPESERGATVELIYSGDSDGFAITCGIRIQGGWNRRPEESPKHSFRLLFRKKYGADILKFPLFGQAGIKEFETLILRGGNNNSWLHWSGEERRRADFIRDQWMRDTLGAMGHPSARGLFVHLYLNGLYWGLYNLCERPSAPFAAAHIGGSEKDYDSMNAGKILEGDKAAWNKMFTLANAGLAGDREFLAMEEMLDLSAFIDYMIANLYGANADWDRSSNWYAARRRSPPGKFQFFVWDGERTLERVGDNTINFDDDQSPPRLFHKLRANAEFRLQFADCVHRHFSDGGALGPAVAAERFRRWATNIEDAVVAESARWGDYRRDVHQYKTGPYELYTRDEHWRPEITRLLTEYFPKRTAVALQQFRDAGLYPKLP